jgi:hypothetical protein
VFKVKKDEHGAVVRYKARLVVKGYAQRQGVDYDEVFAPVARMEAVRLLLALAAQNGWEVHHMDVKTAFLNGELQEEVFVDQPPGFAKEGEEHKVLKLTKPCMVYIKLLVPGIRNWMMNWGFWGLSSAQVIMPSTVEVKVVTG